MLKSKNYLIITILAVILMVFNTLSFAADITENVNATEVIIDSNTSADNETISEENFEEEDFEEENFEEETNINTENSNFYSIGKNDVLIDHQINGNVYIIANNVTIESEIDGDVFVITNKLNITENGYANNVFVIGNDINVDGRASIIYACADNLTVNNNAYIEKDVNAVIKTFNVFGIIERSANATFDKISFTKHNDDEDIHGEIDGNLNYVSDKQADIDENSVYGNINYIQKAGKSMFSYIKNLATLVVTVFIVYLVMSWLAPKFKDLSKDLLKTKLLSVLGFGAIALLVTPIAILILMLLGVASNVALALLAVYVLLLTISSAIFIIALSELIIEKLKIDIKHKQWGIVSLITLVMWVIKLIPILGGIISIFATVTGMGLIIKAIKSKD